MTGSADQHIVHAVAVDIAGPLTAKPKSSSAASPLIMNPPAPSTEEHPRVVLLAEHHGAAARGRAVGVRTGGADDDVVQAIGVDQPLFALLTEYAE
ncbi:MAG: hypothetical protein U0168_12370 [Nannocystaceae bacterium]